MYGTENAVTSIDKDNKMVTLACGRKIAYDALISTIPLDITLRWLGKSEWADGLTHSSSHIIGIGGWGAAGGAWKVRLQRGRAWKEREGVVGRSLEREGAVGRAWATSG